MKNFGTLLLAAILGSIVTIAGYEWLGKKENRGVTISHIDGLPTSQVAYRINEKGEVVPLDFTTVAEKVTKAVVHIRSTQSGNTTADRRSNDPIQQFFFGPDGPIQHGPSVSSGSGVLINGEGYIVTNNHVVQDADIVDVILSDNRSFKAEVIGTDPDTDLAVIKINQKDLPFLSFVNSDNSKVGEWVLAVGNPFNLTSTVTAGIISAKGRNINIINSNNPSRYAQQGGSTAIESFIQTDAAINPGNSGGALVDLEGGLLGINTAIASNTGSYAGYGFAVPSNIVSKVVEDIIAYGMVQRGWLGISVTSVNSDLAKANELDVTEGAYVAGFSKDGKSAAQEAGIQEGDVVIKMDNSEIKSSAALIEFVGRKRPGDKINVTVDRKGKTMVIAVVLKNKEGKVGTVKKEERDAVASLGIDLRDVDPKELKKLDLKSGVEVTALTHGVIEKYTDMREGFIITHVDNAPVSSAKDLTQILNKKKQGDQVILAGVYPDFPREYLYAFRF
ncbi:MAG: trypsin-like peptidase domain-containing protein [Bacteroidetes bacterium]|nr:trypsin-like peptidase domain-containing protein [Bacteroidota bacterium]